MQGNVAASMTCASEEQSPLSAPSKANSSPAPPPESLDSFRDPRNYIDEEWFFGFLQDEGALPKAHDRPLFACDPHKSKSKHVRFGDRLYSKIWQAPRPSQLH